MELLHPTSKLEPKVGEKGAFECCGVRFSLASQLIRHAVDINLSTDAQFIVHENRKYTVTHLSVAIS